MCSFVELGGIASVGIGRQIPPGRCIFRPGWWEAVVQPVVQPVERIRAIPRSHPRELGTNDSDDDRQRTAASFRIPLGPGH